MPRARKRRTSAPSFRGAVLGQGERLVLVHGGPGLEHRVLLPLAEQLATDFEVWACDLPGHGAEPRVGDPTLSQLQRHLARVVNEQGGADVIVGHSLGAWLVREGLRTGTLRPRRGAVLVAPPAGGQPRTRSKAIRRERPGDIAAGLAAQVELETGRPPSERFVACLEAAVLHPVQAYPRLREAVARALAKPLVRMRAAGSVCVLVGEVDAVVHPNRAEEVATATGASFTVLPGVGHYPAATGDDGVAAAIRDAFR